MKSDDQLSAPRPPRGFALVGSLRNGARRFPVVAALSLVAFVLELLFTFDVIESVSGADLFDILTGYSYSYDFGEGVDLLAYLASRLSVACPFGGVAAVVAQLRAERAGVDDERARREQVIAGVTAVLASMLLAFAGEQLGRETLFTLMRFGLMLAGVLWGVWLLMTPDNERSLFPRLVCAGAYTGFLSGVLLVGLCICVLAAEVLVFDFSNELGKFYDVAVLLSLVLLAPNMLCAKLPRQDDGLRTSRAYHVLVGYVILPLCLILLGVLYLYIGKIAFTRSMPSGEMNWFGSFALLVYGGLWLGLRDMEWGPAQKFVRWGWALLVPVVVTQIIGVAIRFQAYGLTTARYAGMLCLAVGVCCLVMAAFDRSPRDLFVLAAAVALAGTVSPANILDIPNLEQTSRLMRALGDAGMLDDEGKAVPAANGGQVPTTAQEQIASSWDYLCYADNGYFSSALVEDLRERAANQGFKELFGFERPAGEYENDGPSDWRRISYEPKGDSLAIKGFSRAYNLDYASVGTTYDLNPENEFKLSLAWDDGAKLEVSLRDLVKALPTDVSSENATIELPAEDLRVDVGDGRVIALSSVSLEIEGGKASSLTVEGLLLVP